MRPQLILLGVLIVFGVFSPLIGGMNPYYYDILISIGINIILAVGLNLVNGYTGQFSLGHAGFMAVGAYASSWLTLRFGYSIGNGAVPTTTVYFMALLAGGLGAAITGLAVGVPSLRLKGDYLAIVTLGFNEIIKGVIQNAEPLGAQRGLGGMEPHTNFFWTFGFAALTVYVVVSLVNSTYGRGFLAVRDDEIAAEAMGINTTKYKVLAFVLGAFFAGIAGGLYAHFKQFIHPEGFNFMKSVDVVVMVILGGMGSTAGVCFAAVLLTILPELLRYVAHPERWSNDWMLLRWAKETVFVVRDWIVSLGHWAESFSPAIGNFIQSLPTHIQSVVENRMILYSLLLIILMLTRPQGLFGSRAAVRKKS